MSCSVELSMKKFTSLGPDESGGICILFQIKALRIRNIREEHLINIDTVEKKSSRKKYNLNLKFIHSTPHYIQGSKL